MSYVFGQKENERRRQKYEQEMSQYQERQGDAGTAAGVTGGVTAAMSAIPYVGPIIAALGAVASPLIARYGAGEEPDAPEYVKEREFQMSNHQPRTSRSMDPASELAPIYSDGGGMEPAQDYRLTALDDLRTKRRQRNLGGVR